MALAVFGRSGDLSYGLSAVLYIDGKAITAVEGECFVRDKQAKNCRAEPLVRSQKEALNMFYRSDLEYPTMEDVLVVGKGAGRQNAV